MGGDSVDPDEQLIVCGGEVSLPQAYHPYRQVRQHMECKHRLHLRCAEYTVLNDAPRTAVGLLPRLKN